MIERISTQMKTFDWQFIKGLSLNSIGIALGRILGFAYSFIVANVFSTSEFGHVTYSLTLAGVVAIMAKPFCQHVIAYYIGKYKEHPDELEEVMPTVWMVALATTIITIVVAVPVLLLTSRFSWEVMIVYLGTIAFYAYYGTASGFLASNRLVLAYIGSNVVQVILLVGLVYVLNIRETAPVIAVFGLSYFLPIMVLMRAAPLNAKVGVKFNPEQIRKVIRFSIPIWLSHALYLGYISLDILLLERFGTDSDVGIYSLTKTLISVFYFVPNGITILLLPKLAGMTSGRKQVIFLAIGVAMTVNIIGLTLYMLIYQWFVINFFGPDYFLNLEFAFVAAFGAMLFGMHTVLTSMFVGLGRASTETVSRILMTLTTLIGGVTLVPSMGVMGTAITMACAAGIGLIVYIFFAIFMRQQNLKTKLAPATASDMSSETVSKE